MSDTPHVSTHLLAASHLLSLLDDLLVSASNSQTGLNPDELQVLVMEIRDHVESVNAVGLNLPKVPDLPAPRLASPWDDLAESEAVQHG